MRIDKRLQSAAGRHKDRLSVYFATFLAACLALIPAVVVWDYGGVLPWTQAMASYAIMVVATLAVPFWIVQSSRTTPLQWAMPILACSVVGIGSLQSIAIPASVGRVLAPATDQAYRDWVAEPIRAELADRDPSVVVGFQSDLHPTTVCRSSTLQAIVPFALVSTVIAVLVCSVRDRRTLCIALVLVALSGTAVSLYGLFNASVPSPSSSGSPVVNGAPFGPFINRNNAGGFLNLTLAASLGLFVWSIRKASRQSSIDPTYEIPPENRWERLLTTASTVVRSLDGPSVILLGMVVIHVVAIAASQSRGAMVAAVAGGAIASLQLARRQRTISPVLVLSVVLIMVLGRWGLIYLGLEDVVSDRVDSIFTLSEGSQVGRWELVTHGMAAATQYFPAGSGLGTYRYAALPFQQVAPITFLHADSMPVEWIVEGGLWIVVVIALAIVAMMKGLSRMASHRRSHLNALAAMGWFMLVSQLVACCFDFGILLPANYLTAAVLVGVFFGMLPERRESVGPRKLGSSKKDIRRSNQDTNLGAQKPSSRTSLKFVLAPLCVIVPVATMLVSIERTVADQASQNALIYRARNQLALIGDRKVAAFNGSAELVSEFQRVLAKRADGTLIEPELALVAATLVLRYQEMGPNPSSQPGIKIDSDAKTIDAKTLIQLQRDRRLAVRRMLSTQAGIFDPTIPGVDPVLVDGQSLEQIRLARHWATEALVQCPLHPLIRLPIIRTDFVRRAPDPVPGTTDEFTNIDRGDADLTYRLVDELVRLQPGNPGLIEQAVRLVYIYPGPDRIEPLVKRILELEPARFDAMWPLIQGTVVSGSVVPGSVVPGGEDLEAAIDPMIPDRLDAVLVVAESNLVPVNVRRRMLERASGLLADDPVDQQGRPMAPSATAFASARIDLALGRGQDGIEKLETAVRLAPSNASYRNLLIQELIQAGEFLRAAKHLERAIVQRPTDTSLIRKLKEVRNR